MFRKLIGSFLLLATILGVYNYHNDYKNYNRYKPVLSRKTETPVEISGRVGGYTIDVLTGWTSPYAEVTLSSQQLQRKTNADDKGFFAFYFIPVPENVGELCLIAQDVNQLPSYPVCLPKPPTNQNLEIKDVLLPPTISIAGDKIPAGETAKASGMTYPNAEVDVHLFSENNQIKLTLVKNAYAAGLPRYRIKSNENGHFEFSLPASYPSINRLFVTSGQSPKSNTLAFQTIGLWGLIKAFFANFFSRLTISWKNMRTNLFWLIVLEVAILTALILLLLNKPGNKRKS